MTTPPTNHLRIIRRARECPNEPGVWADAFRGIDWSRAEKLSDKPGRTVWRVDLPLPGGPQRVVLKVQAHASPIDAMRSMLHGGRLRRHWRGAAKLSRRGFRVARGRALLRGFSEGRLCDVLVMDCVEGTPLIDVLAGEKLTTKQQHALASKLGELVSLLDRNRLHSKDLKPSNILVSDDDPTDLAIIDSDAVGKRPAHPLLPLALEPIGVGVLPRKALLARVIKSWAWNEWLHGPAERPGLHELGRHERIIARDAWAELERLIEKHGDPTPLHNPLTYPIAGRAAADRGEAVALAAASG